MSGMAAEKQMVIDEIDKADWLLESLQHTLEVVECAYDTNTLANKCYALAITKVTKELLGNVRVKLEETEAMVRQMK